MATLKVFSAIFHMSPAQRAKYPGLDSWRNQARVVMATTSRSAFARALGESPRGSWVRNHVGETGNREDVAMAMMHPHVVLMHPLDNKSMGWIDADTLDPLAPPEPTVDRRLEPGDAGLLAQVLADWLDGEGATTEYYDDTREHARGLVERLNAIDRAEGGE